MPVSVSAASHAYVMLLSWMHIQHEHDMTTTDIEENKLLNKVIIFVLFVQKKVLL